MGWLRRMGGANIGVAWTADAAVCWKGSETLAKEINSKIKMLKLFEEARHELLNDLDREWLRERVYVRSFTEVADKNRNGTCMMHWLAFKV